MRSGRQANAPWYPALLEKCNGLQEILKMTGYDLDIVGDFFEPFHEAYSSDASPLLDMFTTEYTSDTIVCYLRILTAAILKRVFQLVFLYITLY